MSKWTFNLVGMYESGPLSVRLAYNRRSNYPEGPIDPGGFQGHARPSPRLDLSASYTFNDNITFFVDWTNILNKPFKSDVRRLDLSTHAVLEEFPMLVRYEEQILSAGVRFHFGREARRAAVPPPPIAVVPPPPPVVEAPPPPAAPPPPPPATSGERGS